MEDIQKIAFGIVLGLLAGIIAVMAIPDKNTAVLCMLILTTMSAYVYDKGLKK